MDPLPSTDLSMPRRLLPAVSIAIATLTACSDSTGPNSKRLTLDALSAPSAVAEQTPLVVAVRYVLRPCERLTAIRAQLAPNVITVEARGRYVDPGPLAECYYRDVFRDTTVTIPRPPLGDLLVRGLQPEGPALEARVRVGIP